ncbi:sugar-binding transcriptional regulator [Alkaliphilus sp. B6464]|uniref:sugar-binding transcriptional regulator n=1 Tax=Alkaliphilus sp. B6464 TaxID=2731219 RepID=UPI001BA5C02E|nr:sugar-binding domain-containing protein [Alkaliphilus sp. B6464]QUH21346.1 sugar-binding transcriptional regulator [Alkaliphilus sp. B6464]
MKDIINLQKKIIPEIFPILEKRYNILRNIYLMQPVGRRNLANKLSVGERIIRTEVDVLKNQGLVEVDAAGMTITEEGKIIAEELKDFIYSMRGIEEIQDRLKNKLGISKVIVVPGNVEEDDFILNDLGKATAKLIEKLATNNTKVGITGGTTMAAVAKGITQHTKKQNIKIVPARGGLGKQVETQANTIAAEIASRLNGSYELLHASDTLSNQTMEILLQDREIERVIKTIKSVDLLVFGIGRADTMARRRELPKDIVGKLAESNAVSEAFGYYFNQEGNIVHETKTIGIDLKDFQRVPNTIGVAGGQNKAEAILAITSLKKSMILVTDEAAATMILEKF